MPRLHIASGLFAKLMDIDKDEFFADPYRQAQRALMLADTLMAAHKITEPERSDGSDPSGAADQVDISIGMRAAKAEFGLRYLGGSDASRGRAARH